LATVAIHSHEDLPGQQERFEFKTGETK
jgi:hypothetical protein